MVLPCVMVCDDMQCIQQASVVMPVCVCVVCPLSSECVMYICMYVFLLPADCLYTAPVEVERGCLPSPEELKRKILVKVHFHVCYIGLMYVRMYVRTCIRPYVHTCVLLCVHTVHSYIHTYLLPVLASIGG